MRSRETAGEAPVHTDAINRHIKRLGERAGFDFQVHCHMLRHGCGYALANAGHDTRAIQDWLGHRSIQHNDWLAEFGINPHHTNTAIGQFTVKAEDQRTGKPAEWRLLPFVWYEEPPKQDK